MAVYHIGIKLGTTTKTWHTVYVVVRARLPLPEDCIDQLDIEADDRSAFKTELFKLRMLQHAQRQWPSRKLLSVNVAM